MQSENTDKSSKKRGKPPDGNFSEDALKAKLREIALRTDEELNPSKLERMTGIKRRNWNKVIKEIKAINDVHLGINPEAFKDFPLPNIKESFDLHYGKNKNKLMEIFQSYNEIITMMWKKSTGFDKQQQEYEEKLAGKDRAIERLKEELKGVKEDVEFHKIAYAQICGESTYSSKREELNLKKNVLEVQKGNKKILDIDFSKQFDQVFKNKNDKSK